MASNEIFVLRSVLYIQAILDHGEAIKTWLKSKSDPITVTCGHKKGPALGKHCLLQATITIATRNVRRHGYTLSSHVSSRLSDT